MIDKEKRIFGKWWLWVVFMLVITLPILWGLSSAGLIGKTIVERKVFEQSYQRKAGDAAKLSIFEAQKASIQSQLRRSDIPMGQRNDYEAQLSAINIQISSLKGQ